jgi:hypothetical protein
MQWRTEVDAASHFLYLALPYCLALQTIGEEYAGIVLATTRATKPSRWAS